MGKLYGSSLIALSIALSGCDTGPTAEPAPTTPAGEPRPAARYDLVEGDVYFYVGDSTAEKKAEGKILGSVSSFRYFGKNKDGLHEIASLSDNGKSLFNATCAEPCVIIKLDDGERLPFDPSSIIGAVFQDALDGHLKVSSASATEKSTLTVTQKDAYPRYVSSVPKDFLGYWDEMIADGCEARETRFFFGKREFANFEVKYEVTNVKLYSPTELDLSVTTTDDSGGQVDGVWEFKLADGGKTLTGRKEGTTFFQRCPI